MEMSDHNVLKLISKVIEDKKGFNTVILDVQSVSDFTSYFVFTEGNVHIHVGAIATALVEELKKQHIYPLRQEGVQQSDWAVLDYGFLIIHVFVSSVRERYRLEELWKNGEIVSA